MVVSREQNAFLVPQQVFPLVKFIGSNGLCWEWTSSCSKRICVLPCGIFDIPCRSHYYVFSIYFLDFKNYCFNLFVSREFVLHY